MAWFLTLVAIVIVFEIVAIEVSSTVALSSLRDPKHRTELVDEAFLEQKDVLLEMLEAKLKEVKDKKKKKKSSEKSDLKLDSEQKLCDTLLKDERLVMKANGISNVGIVNILMNYGASGRGHLNLDAVGISNVGRAHLELGMEGGVNVPGISNSLVASPPRFNALFCDNKDPKDAVEHSSPDILPKEDFEDTSFRTTDMNTTIIVVNSTLSDVNATGAAANATNTADITTGTAFNATNTAIIATDTAVIATDTAATTMPNSNDNANAETVDSDDIDVSNITATVGNIITTVTNSPATMSVHENTVTLLNNLNTVPE